LPSFLFPLTDWVNPFVAAKRELREILSTKS
jgi:hypothetical protein